MNGPLRILHLEDDIEYSSLVRSLLEAEGIEVDMLLVTSRQEFETALELETFDIILADFLLPDYTGLDALATVRERLPEIPFLLVSGTIAEGTAIDSLKSGATDYVLKVCPERLVPTIRRALAEAQERARRVKVESELARQEEYFRTVTENILDILLILDQTARLLYTSPSVHCVLGLDPAEVVGTEVFAYLHGDDLPSVREGMVRLAQDPHAVVKLELRARHADGSYRVLEALARNRMLEGDAKAVVVSARDITDRKNAEAHLRESENQYRLIFDENPIPMWVFDHETLVFLEVNDAAVQCYGYSREEFLGMTLKDIRLSDEGPALLEYLHRLVPVGGPCCANGDVRSPWMTKPGLTGQWQHRRKDGSIIDVEVKWTPIGFGGRPASLAMANDVTMRKRAEQALKESEMLFHSVWENTMDGLRLTDAEGNTVAVNSAFCRIVALPRADLEQRPYTEIYSPDEQPECLLQAYREKFRERRIEGSVERKVVLRGGGLVTLEERASFVELPGREPLLLSVLRDVTAQKRLEDQFRHAQKMEAIGQLAGGVAHDFNNILTVIHGHGSLLVGAGNLPDSAARSAEQIVQAAERAAGLTRQLLTFSRRQVLQTRRLDLNEVVGNLTKMLGRILGEDIALQLNYSPQPAFVDADAGMIEQVLMNLAVNSRDAMPQGGVLNIRVAWRDIKEHELHLDPEAVVGDFVCLSVADTGCGIPRQHIRRVFEPFFTTKEVGKGTGLGLATVYGIVKQHQGWVHVESEIGKGTTFRVFLPRVAHAPPRTSEHPATTAVRGGQETILVVEDEEPVRELVCHLLSRHGYEILQAESGPRALDIWRERKEDIDLLLTDLVMPDRMNGRELAEQLWADRPELKVVFTSGYSAEVVGRDFDGRGALQYLQKPYHPVKLASIVRDCLDA